MITSARGRFQRRRVQRASASAFCGPTTTPTCDGEAALDTARANPPDLVLSDVMMPGLDGFPLPSARIFFVSARIIGQRQRAFPAARGRQLVGLTCGRYVPPLRLSMRKRRKRNLGDSKARLGPPVASEDEQGTWWERHWRGFLGLFAVLSLIKMSDWFVELVLERSDGVAIHLSSNCCSRVAALLAGGLVSLLLHAITWWGFEKRTKTNYGPGGTQQPQGLDGGFFGMTITLPLMVAPHLMFRAFGVPVLPSHHWHSWFITMLIATPAYVAIYGLSDRIFPGIRKAVLSSSLAAMRPERQKLQIKEGIILLSYISGISLLTIAPYRLLTDLSSFDRLLALRLSCAVSVPFVLGLAYILFFDPEAVETLSGGNRRGYMVAFLLMISLYLALYA